MFRFFSSTLLLNFFVTGFTVTGTCQVPSQKDRQAVADTGMNSESLLPGFTHDPAYRALLQEGLTIQRRIDSLFNLSVSFRKEAGRMDQQFEKYQLQKKVTLLEDSIRLLNLLADSIFSLVSAMENGTVLAGRPFLLPYALIGGIQVYTYNLEQLPRQGPAGNIADGSVKKDSLLNLPVGSCQFEIFPDTLYLGRQAIDTAFEIPGGVFYWIQLAAFSKPVGNDYFGGLWPVTMVRLPGQELVKYYAGRFRKIEDARRALGQVRESGLSDAFIVGYFNGQNMSLPKVEQYEKPGGKEN